MMIMDIKKVTSTGKTLMDAIKLFLLCLAIPSLVHVNAAELEYRIDEEQLPDTYVGNVADDYDLRSTMTLHDYDSLVYRILTTGNVYAPYFKIHEKEGKLYTNASLDRDSIPECSQEDVCVVSLDIAIQTQIGAFFRKISVDVIVDDVNDNKPQFMHDTDSVEFSESSVVGTYATISGARDSDVGNYSVQNYYIATSSVPFDVTLEKLVDGSSVVKIVVTGLLDREKLDFYEITVVAEDGGDPRLVGFLTVNVTILDVNDNKPVFDELYYNVTIPEDYSLNKTFLTVHATDADDGANADVEYRLSSNLNDDVKKLFSINASTGELALTGQLVSRPDEEIRIYVEAVDKGKQPKVAQVLTYINVEDTSNTAPEIKVNILSGNVHAVISEYANVGAVVAFIAVTDVDTGRNGQVECTTISEYFKMERLKENEYKAVTTRNLNREFRDRHDVTIICRDNGTPKLNSTASFSVAVLDENDNPPRFSQTTYFPKTEENNQIGDVIARVFADDIDLGRNAEISYSLYNTSGYDFWIDHASGEIRANFVLDREQVNEIPLVVKATDNGRPIRSATANVKLIVTDQNDNKPHFVQTSYVFPVHEGIHLNSTIDQLIATDKDYGENGSVSFSFETVPASNFPFILYSDGTIKMIRSLDRETNSRYAFSVIASDRGLPALSSSVSVTVIVLDVNDNEPRFVFPNTVNNTVEVSLESHLDTLAITVKAIDFDEGVNKGITYSIIDNNFTDMFQMGHGAENGVIKVMRFPGRSDPLKYNLLIKAEDHGKNPMYSVQTLAVVFTSESGSADSSNFVLAVSFACATILLSGAIIVTIFFIRRRDRNSCNDFVDCSKSDFQIVSLENKQNVTVSDTVSEESVKDGGFTADNDSSLNSDHWRPVMNSSFLNQNVSEVTENKNSQKNCQSRDQDYDPCYQKLDPAALQLHRSLLKAHVQSFKASERNQGDDNGSELSNETNTVDSGKGSSVSDVMARDIEPGKTVTFADQPMLYRFLQSSCRPANNSRETIIPSIPEYVNKQQPGDRNMPRNDKYADEYVGRDGKERRECNYNSCRTRNEDYNNSPKDYAINFRDRVLNDRDHDVCDSDDVVNGRNCDVNDEVDVANDGNFVANTRSRDYAANNRDCLRPPLCNRNRNKNFHSREASASIPSIYSDTQSETNRRSHKHRILSPTFQLTHNNLSDYIRNPPNSVVEHKSVTPNSDYGSEVWESSYVDDDDTTTEGSYTIEQLDSPTNSSHKHSRSFMLAPNEAYC